MKMRSCMRSRPRRRLRPRSNQDRLVDEERALYMSTVTFVAIDTRDCYEAKTKKNVCMNTTYRVRRDRELC